MKTSKAVLNQLILALACVGLATPIFAHEQVKADELFGTVAVQEQVYGRGGASLINKETGEVYSWDPETGQPYTLEKLLELGTISADDYQKYVAIRQAAGDKSGEHSANQPLDVDKMLEELPEKAKMLAIAELKNDVNGLGEWYDEATLQALNEVGYFEKRRQLIEEYKAQLLAEQAAQVPQPTESPQQQLVSEQEAVQNVAAQPQAPVQSTPSKTSESTKVLPRTSDATSILSVFGLVIGLLGLAGLKKRSN